LCWSFTHLVGILNAARTVHTEAILLPERALAVEVDLVVLEERLGDEVVQRGEELLVDALDRLVCTVCRLDGA
jgi:hypothetical protein